MNKSEMRNAFLGGKLAVTLASASEVDKFLDILESKGHPTLYLWREYMSDNGIDPESGVYAIICADTVDELFCVLTLELFLQWLDEDDHMAVKYDTAEQVDFI